ncbi:hypothetical protein HWV62_9359 [Athelia sp. TMB]|nr:hypothetical protein HWV62_4065 [Athelia sp. TMB]KAF7975532.1 hypothetical protein HWV62_9359 [Athelia sp. TMB]
MSIQQSKQLVWLITGTSAGFGRLLTLAALERGDKVIATARARSMPQLSDLKAAGADVLELDVTAPLATLQAVAEQALALHGRVDVVVNNAGFIGAGSMEENTPEETLAQFSTNVFGGMNVARAFLPAMRAARSGTVIFFGSMVGWTPVPHMGLYGATKFAVRGLSEALHAELAPLGLRSVCIEPGAFRTAFLAPGARTAFASRIGDYAEGGRAADGMLQAYNGQQLGDPEKGARLIVDVVRGEGKAAGRVIPSVLSLGSDAYTDIRAACEERIQVLDEWKEVTVTTDF